MRLNEQTDRISHADIFSFPIVIPTAQDRAPKDGQALVHVGSNGAHSTASGVSANATDALAGTGETGGRMAHANQQREEGQFPKQVSKSSSLFPLSVKSEPAEEGASLAENKKTWRKGLSELTTAYLLLQSRARRRLTVRPAAERASATSTRLKRASRCHRGATDPRGGQPAHITSVLPSSWPRPVIHAGCMA